MRYSGHSSGGLLLIALLQLLVMIAAVRLGHQLLRRFGRPLDASLEY